MRAEALIDYVGKVLKIFTSKQTVLTGRIQEVKQESVIFLDKYGEKHIIDVEDILTAKIIGNEEVDMNAKNNIDGRA